MTDQLRFAFGDEKCTGPAEPALWLAASQLAPPRILQRLLEAPGGVIVDAMNGTSALPPGDIIVVRGRGENGFSVYAHAEEESESVLRSVTMALTETRVDASPGNGVRELMLFGVCPGGIGQRLPYASATGLERAIAVLRHRETRKQSGAILGECLRLARAWPANAPALLRGLVEREHADALLRLGRTRDEWQQVARCAASSFEQAGRTALARRTLRYEACRFETQFELELGASAERGGARVDDVGYRAEKLFARRLPLRGSTRPTGGYGSARDWPWRLKGRLSPSDISDAIVCRALAGATGRTLGPDATLTPRRGPRSGARLVTGFETEIAVLLGIAGRTGQKAGRYTARVFSRSCRISPQTAQNTVGVLSEFVIWPDTPGRHRLEVELRTTSDRIARLSLEMPA